MTSPTKPQRYSSSCARMLCAVAAASLSTTSLLRTQIANPSVVPIQAKTPAILAWKRGDASLILPVVMPVSILVSPCTGVASRDHWMRSYALPGAGLPAASRHPNPPVKFARVVTNNNTTRNTGIRRISVLLHSPAALAACVCPIWNTGENIKRMQGER